jgi:hypothetical protein
LHQETFQGDETSSENGDEKDQSHIEYMNTSQWWAAGPPGEFQFLMLIHYELASELGNYGMRATQQLPSGWEIDESVLREFAEDNEREFQFLMQHNMTFQQSHNHAFLVAG